MLPLNNNKKKKTSDSSSESEGVFNVSNLPQSMDVYWRSFSEFVPEGVDFDSLSDEEKQLIKNKYRFAYLRPGKYQSITGIGGQNGRMYP